MSTTKLILLAACLTAWCGRGALAETAGKLPAELEGIGITEKLGDALPLDLAFVNEAGKPVTLGELLRPGKPVVLNLGYFGCPMLCGLVMNGMTDAMKETSLMPGEDYIVLSISIDAGETHRLARIKKQNYIREIGRPAASTGWHFLTGSEANIAALTDAAGFHFKWIEDRREFVHAAGVIILTPDGKVSRYLYGTTFPAQTFRLSLVEASEGKIGSALDRFLLFCFQYDGENHRYTLAAVNLVRLGGLMTLLILGGLILRSLRRERRRKDHHGGTETRREELSVES